MNMWANTCHILPYIGVCISHDQLMHMLIMPKDQSREKVRYHEQQQMFRRIPPQSTVKLNVRSALCFTCSTSAMQFTCSNVSLLSQFPAEQPIILYKCRLSCMQFWHHEMTNSLLVRVGNFLFTFGLHALQILQKMCPTNPKFCTFTTSKWMTLLTDVSRRVGAEVSWVTGGVRFSLLPWSSARRMPA